ncbi:4-hydroxy-tetrahydrodipicolinate synthase [Aeromonas veronii]|uniref:4-hydroxy-tetrahydrodipicolinate synthase n=1 Tax=Aeromonas veronii TaxID=654 RepID=UPI003BA250AE
MLKGSYVALITPFNQDGGVDYDELKTLINFHVDNGTSGIVVVGTTGESATLSIYERLEVIRQSVAIANGSIPIYAGTGANSTLEAIDFTKEADKLGVSGCLSVTPYYNKPSQRGLYLHFEAIANSTKSPQILYNVPSRTGVDLLPETVGQLSEIDNICALKDSSSDMARVALTKKITPSNFSLLSGDDVTAFTFMSKGGDGVISVTANIVPNIMSSMINSFLNGDISTALECDTMLSEINRAMFLESNPIPVKWAAHKIGLIKNNVLRLPLTSLDEKYIACVSNALKVARCI